MTDPTPPGCYVTGDPEPVTAPADPAPTIPAVAAQQAEAGGHVMSTDAENLLFAWRWVCTVCAAPIVAPRDLAAGWGAAVEEGCPVDWRAPDRPRTHLTTDTPEDNDFTVHAAESGSG